MLHPHRLTAGAQHRFEGQRSCHELSANGIFLKKCIPRLHIASKISRRRQAAPCVGKRITRAIRLQRQKTTFSRNRR
jgi:hypothetical protein